MRYLLFSIYLIAAAAIVSAGQTGKPALVVKSEPGAIIWVDDVRYGRTGSDGRLSIRALPRRSHQVRARADGYAEITRALPAGASEITVALRKTTDQAELAYQEAERLSVRDREKAAEAYRRAIRIKPAYLRAHIGLARVLAEADEVEAALRAIRELRRVSPRNAEASAIEGRILKDSGEEAKAIAAFKRSIAEGRGFQPEAYTGLGLLYKERAEGFAGSGDLQQETESYDEAAKYLAAALKQLASAPDAAVLYQLLGLVYERQHRYSEAIALYQEFLEMFPDSQDAPAVRSFIEQLKKQMP